MKTCDENAVIVKLLAVHLMKVNYVPEAVYRLETSSTVYSVVFIDQTNQ